MSVAVLAKALDILEAMEGLRQPAPLRAIAEAAGLSKATAHRIVQTLVERGYVAQDGATGDYHLTMRLAELGRVTRYDGIIARAEPYLEALNRRFDETTNLAVLEGHRVYYLRSISTSRPLRWIVQPGSSDGFHSTALGRAIVAHLPEVERERLLRSAHYERRTGATPIGADALLPYLDEARALGWAVDDEHNDAGVACFAVPLLEQGEPVAAISISIPRGRVDPGRSRQVVEALVEVRTRWKADGAVDAARLAGVSADGGGAR
jgi:DNA-binding IclR family transcriptional regulator